jgi:hypothetical protein
MPGLRVEEKTHWRDDGRRSRGRRDAHLQEDAAIRERASS